MKNERGYYTLKTITYPNTHKNSRFLSNFCLTAKTRLNYIKSALAKSKASREKLNLLQAHNTPEACFFMRSIFAPRQNKLSSDRLFSMVERSGQPFAVGCLPVMTVSHPVMFYRPTVRSSAVDSENLLQDTAEMIYKFLCVNRTQPHFNLCIQTIQANNETNARLNLSADFQCLARIAQINLENTPKINRTFAQGGVYA